MQERRVTPTTTTSIITGLLVSLAQTTVVAHTVINTAVVMHALV
jgi:hypothetical protein